MKNLRILILLFLSAQTYAQNKQLNLENGIAIYGYDPVAYFDLGKGIKGNNKFTVKHSGAIYYFSSEFNRLKFLKNSSYYLPQYGGWCAYAMGKTGKKVYVNPETFKIINGKLFLFYNTNFNNTLLSWNENEKILKPKADKNWTN